MVRTEVDLTKEQAERLSELASRRSVPIQELISGAVDALLRSAKPPLTPEQRRRAIAAAGRFRSGCGDLSVNHDAYLDEAFGS